MFRLIHFLIALPCAVVFILSAHAQDRSIALVLDASGSMKAVLADGSTRMDAAKTAVARLVTTLDGRTRLALRIYGDQSPTAKKDCKDTRLLGAFGAIEANGAGIAEQARGIQPQGYTPITYALTLAAQDLGAEEASSRTVVLVSDGKETCQGDPCAAAKALADADAKLVVHTVGVGVDAVTRGQLQCIARMARGSYFDANSAAELAAVLGRAAVEPVKTRELGGVALGVLKMKAVGLVEIFGTDGKQVGTLNQVQAETRLAPGIYSVKFGKQLWQGVEIRPGKTTELKPGYLEIGPLGDPFVEVLEPETGEQIQRMFWLEQRKMLLPGQYELKFGKRPSQEWQALGEAYKAERKAILERHRSPKAIIAEHRKELRVTETALREEQARALAAHDRRSRNLMGWLQNALDAAREVWRPDGGRFQLVRLTIGFALSPAAARQRLVRTHDAERAALTEASKRQLSERIFAAKATRQLQLGERALHHEKDRDALIARQGAEKAKMKEAWRAAPQPERSKRRKVKTGNGSDRTRDAERQKSERRRRRDREKER